MKNSPSSVPPELAAIYARQKRTIVRAEHKDGRWKITSDTGRTVIWTRAASISRPWRARLAK
jgi:hypothetical protein